MGVFSFWSRRKGSEQESSIRDIYSRDYKPAAKFGKPLEVHSDYLSRIRNKQSVYDDYQPQQPSPQPREIFQHRSQQQSHEKSHDFPALDMTKEEQETKRILEGIEEIKQLIVKDSVSVDELAEIVSQRVSKDIAEAMAEEMRSLSMILETLPEKTKMEIEPLFSQLRAASSPKIVKTVSRAIVQRLGVGVEELIANGLMSVIREHGQITPSELLKEAERHNICSRASLFRHLQNLVNKGVVEKKRVGRIVYYILKASNEGYMSHEQPRPEPPASDFSDE